MKDLVRLSSDVAVRSSAGARAGGGGGGGAGGGGGGGGFFAAEYDTFEDKMVFPSSYPMKLAMSLARDHAKSGNDTEESPVEPIETEELWDHRHMHRNTGEAETAEPASTDRKMVENAAGSGARSNANIIDDGNLLQGELLLSEEPHTEKNFELQSEEAAGNFINPDERATRSKEEYGPLFQTNGSPSSGVVGKQSPRQKSPNLAEALGASNEFNDHELTDQVDLENPSGREYHHDTQNRSQGTLLYKYDRILENNLDEEQIQSIDPEMFWDEADVKGYREVDVEIPMEGKQLIVESARREPFGESVYLENYSSQAPGSKGQIHLTRLSLDKTTWVAYR